MISVVPMLAVLTTAAELRQAVWERLSVVGAAGSC